MDYHLQHNIDIKIARIFNTYGPHLSPEDGRVISNFIIQALGGTDITIYGNGSQTRSFCYVDDLIDGFIKFMEHPNSTGPINLGNPVENTILEIAELIINMVNSKSKIVFKDLPQDDPTQRCPDITLAKNVLMWEPKVKLQEGLEKTIEYFENKYF